MRQVVGTDRTAGLTISRGGRLRNRLRSFAIFVLVGASGLVGLAQETPPTDKLFTDRVRVDVVEVEVFVTDGQGRPVYGLDRSDFELLVDGRPVEISNFRPPPPSDDRQVGGAAAVIADVEPAQPRYLAVFVDHTNLRPDRRRAVMTALRAFLLERMAGGDRVMVAAYDSRVEVLSGFDDGEAELVRAMEAVDFTAPSAFQSQAEFNRILRCLEVTCENPEFIWDEVRIYARSLRHRSRIMMAHLGSFIDSLSALPGRRSLLLVSDGIAVRPGESLFAAYQRIYSDVEHYGPIQYRVEANRLSLTDDIRELTDLANERRVTIYSLNGGGVVGNPLAMQSVAVSATRMIDNETQFVRDANFMGGLERVAVATGGDVVVKPTAETLAGLSDGLDGGYSLGFNPGHEPDDVSRSIKVRVQGDGYKVRHRENYRLASDEGTASELTRLALITAEAKNPLGISVEFAPTAKREGRKYVVMSAIRIPLEPLTLLPAGDDRVRGDLEITFLLEDADGNSTPIQKSSLPLDLPGAAAGASGPRHITYDVGFMVRTGPDQRLAMTLTDTLECGSRPR